MELNEGLIYTNQNCIGCNRCISGCPVIGANVSVKERGLNRIMVDSDKCIHCGRCLTTCKHNARQYRDDTDRFLEDLQKNEKIALLVAPSFFITYEKEAGQILGYLKHLGVQAIYDVSYGADIATWAYVSYMEAHPQQGYIAPPCSVVVNYIQKYSEELEKKLIPVYSPLLCLAKYLKKYCRVEHRLAFLSPCIAKKDEIEDLENGRLVTYNVTFEKLLEKLEGRDLCGYAAEAEPLDFGLGRIYPVPGGLSDNLRLFMPEHTSIREVHGEGDIYDYFHKAQVRLKKEQEMPDVIDCLNCKQGCLSGTATKRHRCFDDDIFLRLQKYKKANSNIQEDENPYLRQLSFPERRKRLLERFEHLQLEDFCRSYRRNVHMEEERLHMNSSEHEDEIMKIFHAMHKDCPEDQSINCHSCGYKSCREMAYAISRGYNTMENCVHYLKDEAFRASMTDVRNEVPNTNAYLMFVERCIAANTLTNYATISFNINNFKYLNQRFGFRQGDAALRKYSQIVAGLAGEDEIISFTGGNSYMGCVARTRLDEILKRLQSVPLFLTREDGEQEMVFLSARVAVYLPDGSDLAPSMVLEKLSNSYSRLRQFGTGDVIYYDEEFQRQIQREEEVLHAVVPGLERGEFEVYYQPKVDMHSRQLMGAEALIRWNRNGHVVSPAMFIPVCERTGLVEWLDFFVLQTVCKHLVEWQRMGIRIVPISVNFSRHHFLDADVADKINAIAEQFGAPKKFLEVEFTETAYLDENNYLVSNIDRLHGYGIASAMDDFGTGYSSLSMLQEMSVDVLKLDRSFLKDEKLNDKRSQIVIYNVIKMAKDLNMMIVSEGIETEQQLKLMRDLDCDFAQGYLFDKPLVHDEFEARLIQEYY